MLSPPLRPRASGQKARQIRYGKGRQEASKLSRDRRTRSIQLSSPGWTKRAGEWLLMSSPASGHPGRSFTVRANRSRMKSFSWGRAHESRYEFDLNAAAEDGAATAPTGPHTVTQATSTQRRTSTAKMESNDAPQDRPSNITRKRQAGTKTPAATIFAWGCFYLRLFPQGTLDNTPSPIVLAQPNTDSRNCKNLPDLSVLLTPIGYWQDILVALRRLSTRNWSVIQGTWCNIGNLAKASEATKEPKNPRETSSMRTARP